MNENVSVKKSAMHSSLVEGNSSEEQLSQRHIQRLFDTGQHDAGVFTNALGEAETDRTSAINYQSYTPSSSPPPIDRIPIAEYVAHKEKEKTMRMSLCNALLSLGESASPHGKCCDARDVQINDELCYCLSCGAVFYELPSYLTEQAGSLGDGAGWHNNFSSIEWFFDHYCEEPCVQLEDGLVSCANCAKLLPPFFSIFNDLEDLDNEEDDIGFEEVNSTFMGLGFMDSHGTGPTDPSNQVTDTEPDPLRYLNFGYSEPLSQPNSVQSTEDQLPAVEGSLNSPADMGKSYNSHRQQCETRRQMAQAQARRIRPTPPPLCTACLKEDRVERNCSLCVRCHVAGHTFAECMSGPKFSIFMDLASELRERIYSYVLDTDRCINPHMCDSSRGTDIKFHDDNQPEHNGMNAFLGLLRVSKKVRAEALPIFYSTNTFVVGCDTTTYLDRLKHLDRFHMIRHVRFDIPMYREATAPSILRRMNQFIKEVDEYEKVPQKNQTVKSLKQHPQYKQGGLLDINLIAILKKLSSPIPGSTAATGNVASGSTIPPPTLEIILPVPNAQNFAACDRLKWFQTVLYGIGIAVRFADGKPFACTPDDRSISVIWQQRYQKKDFEISPEYVCPLDAEGQTVAYRHALELNAELESEPRSRGWAFMRVSCRNRDVVWFDVVTEGGGISR